MTAETENSIGQSVEDQAFGWLVRIREHADDPTLRSAFEGWLLQSPAHQAAWNETCRMWRAAGDARHHYERLPPRTVRARSRRATHRGITGAAVAAALAACVVFIAGPPILLRLEADHMTANAETRLVHLQDGSTVELGPASAIASDFSNERRLVRLLAGEAYFDVAHDNPKPFRVQAGDVAIDVLGTAFNVSVSEGSTEIGLARGSIKTSGTVSGHVVDRTLVPGELLNVDGKTGSISEETIDPDDVGAWRDQRLIVINATIGSVVEHIQRYHPAWITVADGELSKRRVTGVYRLDDPDKALGALVDPYGGKVRKVSNLVRLVTRF